MTRIAVNIVPTPTGVAVVTTVVLPEIRHKVDGVSLRVSIPAGSIGRYRVCH